MLRNRPLFRFPKPIRVRNRTNFFQLTTQQRYLTKIQQNKFYRTPQKGTTHYRKEIQSRRDSGDTGAALQKYLEMKENGVTPNRSIYNQAMGVYGTLKDPENAIKVFQEMKQNLRPCPVSFHTMMRMYSNLGDIKRTLDMFDEMKKAGWKPR